MIVNRSGMALGREVVRRKSIVGRQSGRREARRWPSLAVGTREARHNHSQKALGRGARLGLG